MNRFVALFILALCLLPSAVSVSAQQDQQCFTQTNQCISGRIREFWEQNGGLSVFGYPTTELREEQIEGKTFQAQWFERVRLELHPENARPYDVLLSRLGVLRLEQQGRDWFSFPKGTQGQAGCRYFAATQHNVCGGIFIAWKSSGIELDGRRGKTEAENLALFGAPISEATIETNASGDTVLTQWFERARFEEHVSGVQLGLLGNELRADVQQTIAPAAPTQPQPTATPEPTTKPEPTAKPEPSGVRVGAVCRDGTRSNATGRGACSHHGGVAHWIYQ